MSVKFNKDMLIKHRFWFIIGAVFILAFAGLGWLTFSEGANISKLSTTLKNGKRAKVMASPTSIDLRTKQADSAKDSESQVWKKAYERQFELFKWAPNIESTFQFFNGKFANDIKVDKAPPSPKEWPADAANLMHGILVNQQEEWFEIKDKDNKVVRFFKTELVKDSITLVGQPQKITFPQMAGHMGKLLIVNYQEGKYFNDPLTITEQRAFAESYKSQVLEILKSIDPLDEKGNGVVQLRDWLFRDNDLPLDGGGGGGKMNFIRYVSAVWGGGGGSSFSHEAWLAQENIWIQKEIYSVIREANDSLSRFTGKEVEETGKVATFTNSYFDIDLSLDAKKSLTFKIKNRLPRAQKLDLLFKVKMSNAPGYKAELVKISGPMLSPSGTKTDSHVQVIEAGSDIRKGIYGIEQVLSWETAAVKRLDHISIGSAGSDDMSHSHRTIDALLPVEKEAASGSGKDPKDPKDPGGIKPGIQPPPGIGGGGNKKMLEHGLWTERYASITEQSRRVPVGIVLIVDQHHIDRVLAAFNNSRLRFLQTQVLLNHYTGSLQPPQPPDEKEKKEGGIGGFKPGPIFQPPPPDGHGGGGGIKPGPFPGGIPGIGGGGGGAPPSQDLETNMELVIYGTMTLYERYPPRPSVEKK